MIFLLKILVRFALRIFCPSIVVKNAELMNTKGPVLLVVNHPDSFLDAVIIGALYPRKINYLARGDVFRNPVFGFLLRQLHLLPVFRQREGKEHLHLNSNTFRQAVKCLRKDGIVLIFIEGICLNTHELQPFKKGASRILESAHAEGIFPTVQIVGLGYSSFTAFGKGIHLAFENLTWPQPIADAVDRVRFNATVFEKMERLIEVPKHPGFPRGLLYYFALPLYIPVRAFAYAKTKGTVFYDSVLFALLLFTFPVYVALVVTIVLKVRLILG
ncbi:1-acyl-sn-glycerol-3-phosphate acyltransferase [Aquirufa sp. A-Brett2-W8]